MIKATLRVGATQAAITPNELKLAENDFVEVSLDTPYSSELVLHLNEHVYRFNEYGAVIVPFSDFKEGTQVCRVVSANGREWLVKGLFMQKMRLDDIQMAKIQQEAEFYRIYCLELRKRVETLEANEAKIVQQQKDIVEAYNAMQKRIEDIFKELNS